MNFEQKFGALPEFNPDEVQSPGFNAGTVPSVPSSPRTFISSYRKKRRLSGKLLSTYVFVNKKRSLYLSEVTILPLPSLFILCILCLRDTFHFSLLHAE